MPVFRVSQGQGEGESLTDVGKVDAGTRDLTRVTNNLRLADHLGQFVAGQVASQFQNENLTDMLKGKNMIMISASWG